jgi:hypothetical protein
MELRIRGLRKDYYSEGKRIRALDDVDLTIASSQIFTLQSPIWLRSLLSSGKYPEMRQKYIAEK